MKFKTEIKIPASKDKINYNDKLFFIGSCFSDSIGHKFKDYFFQTIINPFGVLYNPLSIYSDIKNLLENKTYQKEDLFFYNSIWNSFDHHSDFSDNDYEKVLRKINKKQEKALSFLQKADYLFITFGSAWVFELKSSNKIVANCHKVAEKKFNRRILNIEEIILKYNELIEKLKLLNPKIKIIFTVSPIRHLKDGAHGNQISKSTLILAIEKIINTHDNAEYFPSYEIVLDDLRDYRYYGDDLIHLSNLAVNYIWEKLYETFFSEKTKTVLDLGIKLHKSLNHKILKGNKEELNKFIQSLYKITEKLKKENSDINIKKAQKKISDLEKLLIK